MENMTKVYMKKQGRCEIALPDVKPSISAKDAQQCLDVCDKEPKCVTVIVEAKNKKQSVCHFKEGYCTKIAFSNSKARVVYLKEYGMLCHEKLRIV